MIKSLLCKVDHNHTVKKTTTNEITITIETATAATSATTKLFRWVNIFISKVTVHKKELRIVVIYF